MGDGGTRRRWVERRADEHAVGENFFAGAAAGVIMGCDDHNAEEVLNDVLDLCCVGVSDGAVDVWQRVAHPPSRRGGCFAPSTWWARGLPSRNDPTS